MILLYRGISSKYEDYYIKLNNRRTQIKMVRSLQGSPSGVLLKPGAGAGAGAGDAC